MRTILFLLALFMSSVAYADGDQGGVAGALASVPSDGGGPTR